MVRTWREKRFVAIDENQSGLAIKSKVRDYFLHSITPEVFFHFRNFNKINNKKEKYFASEVAYIMQLSDHLLLGRLKRGRAPGKGNE